MPYQKLGNSEGMCPTKQAFVSGRDGSVIGMISMDGIVTAMIATCAAISAANSETMKASRVFLRP